MQVKAIPASPHCVQQQGRGPCMLAREQLKAHKPGELDLWPNQFPITTRTFSPLPFLHLSCGLQSRLMWPLACVLSPSLCSASRLAGGRHVCSLLGRGLHGPVPCAASLSLGATKGRKQPRAVQHSPPCRCQNEPCRAPPVF